MNGYDIAAKVCGWALGIVLALVFCGFVAGLVGAVGRPTSRYEIHLDGGATFYTGTIENRDGIVVFTDTHGDRVTTTTAHVVSISERVK